MWEKVVLYPKKRNKVFFNGTYLHNIDAKGRLSIPSKLRKYIAPEADNTLFMLPGSNTCIEVYPKNIWMRRVEALSSLPSSNQDALRLMRMIANRTHEDQMDPQYRILIPATLLKYAGIGSEVLIAGSHNRIEFWNPATYEAYWNSSEETQESLMERFLPNV